MIFLRLLGAMIVTDYLLMETILRRTPPDSRFNPHTPHVGSDLSAPTFCTSPLLFQSTLPTWGATYTSFALLRCLSCFNPRSPRGERRSNRPLRLHALTFQSTLPTWGATQNITRGESCLYVSIHAPHVGSDRRQLP